MPQKVIDLNDFEPVPEVVRNVSSLSVRPDGQVSLNEHLLAEIRQRTDSLRFRFLVHKLDKGRLLLLLSGDPTYAFPSSGSKKDRAFSKTLVEHGVPLPAQYSMTWNEGLNGWTGELNGKLAANALAASLRSGRRTKK